MRDAQERLRHGAFMPSDYFFRFCSYPGLETCAGRHLSVSRSPSRTSWWSCLFSVPLTRATLHHEKLENASHRFYIHFDRWKSLDILSALYRLVCERLSKDTWLDRWICTERKTEKVRKVNCYVIQRIYDLWCFIFFKHSTRSNMFSTFTIKQPFVRNLLWEHIYIYIYNI